MPAERCFAPITAPDYMYISCLWVLGKFKGHGYANKLLEECIEDAKSKVKKGIVVLGSKKKLPFLTDPNFLKYKGFRICDEAYPSFELLYYSFNKDSDKLPKFNECAKSGKIDEKEVCIYYSNGCPFTDKYVPIVENILKLKDVPYKINKLVTVKDAQLSPTPCTIYSLFINGKFVTNEIMGEKNLLNI